MKPSHLTQALEVLILARRAAFIEGAPGIGKSQVVQQTADRLGMAVIDIRMAQLDPTDLRGLPTIRGDRTAWTVPDFLPTAGSGILFLDELNRAPAMVQNAGLQLALDRKLGDYVLPDEWAVVAAGNTTDVGVQRMGTALRSRFTFLDAEVDHEDWSKWAVSADIAPETLAFIRFMPSMLHDWDSGKSRSFPTPRGWQFVSDITKQSKGNGTAAIEHELYQGTVGEGAAIAYSAFLKTYRTMPNLDAILMNPNKAEIPVDPAVLFAVSTGLGRRAAVSNFKQVTTYLDRMTAKGLDEYSVFSVKDAVRRDASLASTPEFTKWAVAHADVVF